VKKYQVRTGKTFTLIDRINKLAQKCLDGWLSGYAPDLRAPQAHVLLLHHSHHIIKVSKCLETFAFLAYHDVRDNGNYGRAKQDFLN